MATKAHAILSASSSDRWLHCPPSARLCGECGGWYGSKVWHSTDKYRQTVWQCNRKFDGERKCHTPHFTDEELKSLFISAVNKLLEGKADVITEYDPLLWHGMVEFATVYGMDDIRFTMKDGTEIRT